MLLPHTFDSDSHTYRSEGYFVIATSDVLELNGLASYDGIPKAVLDHASWRGTQTHKAIEIFGSQVTAGQAFDSAAKDVWGLLTGAFEEIKPYFKGTLKFFKDYEFELIGKPEITLVYLHDETAIGCTIDFRGKIHGKGFQGRPMIGDAKTCAKQSGMARKQKLLAWRMQTQSYMGATVFDEDFMRACPDPASRFIVNPNKEGSYEFFDFSGYDDELFWDSAVRIAALKLSNGHKLKVRD